MRIQGNGELLTALLPGLSAPCGGKGRRGKCRVKARGALSQPTEAEKAALSEQEIQEGVRLACQARALGEVEVEFERDSGEVLLRAREKSMAVDPGRSGMGCAIDVVHDHAGGLPGGPGHGTDPGRPVRHEPATALWGGRYQPHPIRHARRRSRYAHPQRTKRNGGGRMCLDGGGQPRNDAIVVRPPSGRTGARALYARVSRGHRTKWRLCRPADLWLCGGGRRFRRAICRCWIRETPRAFCSMWAPTAKCCSRTKGTSARARRRPGPRSKARTSHAAWAERRVPSAAPSVCPTEIGRLPPWATARRADYAAAA